jgi:NTE family protein
MPRVLCYFLALIIPFSAAAQAPPASPAREQSAAKVGQAHAGTSPFVEVTNKENDLNARNTGQQNTATTRDAQEKRVRRPRIGVALEGGGALGLAHIGVLEWFEEDHIPVDYVAGTSMGGLVGGFYATGMSPAEMKKLIEGVDWNEVLGDVTPYEDLSYRRKEDQRAYPNSLILGLKNGVSFPGGLNAGHQIGLLIDRVTLPYYKLGSFESLPTPFRCVATDIVSGKEVIFDHGPLAEALRSTMSIPGAFTPVYDKNRVLVDGGLVNNLPTDVVKQMGADIVIAVHLETQPAEAKNIKSLFNVLQQSMRIVVAESELSGLARADAVITVPLGEFTSTDYKKNEPIMQKGYEAASAKSPLLDRFALSQDEWEELSRERDAKKQAVTALPEFIQVQGADTEQQRESIEHYLAPLAGKPLNTKRLDQVLTRLTGEGRYDTAGYRFIERDGKEGLLVQVSEKSYAPPTIQPGFEVDGSESEEVGFTMASRLTFLDVAGFRSEWRSDFLFGNTYGIASELYRPFTPVSKWFFAPRGEASTRVFKIYQKGDPLSDYKLGLADIGMDVGYGFNRFSELRFGYEVGYLDDELRLGTPRFTPVDGRIGDAKMHYLLDHTDDPVIPRRGVRSETTFRWFDTSPGAPSAFPSLKTNVQYFQPVSALGSVFVYGEGATTFGFNNTGVPQFFLGGPLTLSAYGLNELQGNQYYLFRGGYLHDVWILPPLVGKRVFVFGSYEVAKMYGAPVESKFPNDFATGILAETVLGPVLVGGSLGDSGHRKWFFQLGRVF